MRRKIEALIEKLKATGYHETDSSEQRRSFSKSWKQESTLIIKTFIINKEKVTFKEYICCALTKQQIDEFISTSDTDKVLKFV
jgi:hypothetical protein